MKKILSLTIALIITLTNTAAVLAAGTDLSSSGQYKYKTETISVFDVTNPYYQVTVKLNIPNYLGTIKADIKTRQYNFEKAASETMEYKDAEVVVLYVPNDKWDGECYYNGITASVTSYPTEIPQTSSQLVVWKEFFNYGFLPMTNGGFFYLDRNSMQMSFLSGPGLYSGIGMFSFTYKGEKYDTAAGYPFILIINDTSIEYFNKHRKLDASSSYAWPGLAELLESKKYKVEYGTSGEGLLNFTDKNSWLPGIYFDVANRLVDKMWYDDYVVSCYKKGIMLGTRDMHFYPANDITLAQCITIAARLHNIYMGESGIFNQNPTDAYSVYISYAIANGIINADDFDAAELGRAAYDAKATRGQLAYIFTHCIPADGLAVINDIDYISDVPQSYPYADDIYTLYRAGISQGYADHSFKPDTFIKRSEVAALIARITDKELRLRFCL